MRGLGNHIHRTVVGGEGGIYPSRISESTRNMGNIDGAEYKNTGPMQKLRMGPAGNSGLGNHAINDLRGR